jgi:hypothetical protein
MSVIKLPSGSTEYDYDYVTDDNPSWDYFLIFVCFVIVWWFVLRID